VFADRILPGGLYCSTDSGFVSSIVASFITAEEFPMNTSIGSKAMGHIRLLGSCGLALAVMPPVHGAERGGGRIQPTDCWEIRAIAMPGGAYSQASDVNDSGQVIGTAQLPNSQDEVAFITAPNGGALTPIVHPDSPRLSPVAVNNVGQVVGYYPAFVTDPGGTNVRFTLVNAIARDINDAGQTLWDIEQPYYKGVIGPTEQPSNTTGVGLTEVEVLPSWVPMDERYVSSNALNDHGQVAITGTAFPGNPEDGIRSTAYRWSQYEGAIQLVPGAYYSMALKINDRGQVAGVFSEGTGEQAFVTRPYSTELLKLGDIGDGNTPTGMNNFGQLVGIHAPGGEYLDAYVTVPFFVDRSIAINSLREVVREGWTQIGPTAINNRGQITGSGLRNGARLAFLLTPLSLQAYLPTLDGSPATCYRWDR
jgi:uncharacterized membrane protein